MAAAMTAWRFVPLLLFAGIVGAMVWRLAIPPTTTVESKMIGKPLPEFDLPPAFPGQLGLARRDLVGAGPHLVNVFASWCVPCATEAGVLGTLNARGASIEGIAIRDQSEDLGLFLARYGDPFDRIGADRSSQLQIALGSSGVPESFIVDGRGIIRYQHIGPIDAAEVPAILAQLEQAR